MELQTVTKLHSALNRKTVLATLCITLLFLYIFQENVFHKKRNESLPKLGILYVYFIERFHTLGQQLYKFIGTKESFNKRRRFKSHRTGLGHQLGCRFIVWGHQCGGREVM